MKRGDVWWVSLEPAVGGEVRKDHAAPRWRAGRRCDRGAGGGVVGRTESEVRRPKWQYAIKMTVEAICGSAAARRTAEDKK
jgi:hypothetical protein